MPLPAKDAARRRDLMLARTRRLSVWLAGSAAAASIGLGTAFACTLPGHHAPAASAQQGAGTQPGARTPATPLPRGQQPAGPPPASPGSTPGRAPAARQPAAPSPAATHLARPSQPPAATPAQHQTVSGGS
jgi:hypothetical protein